MWQTYLWFNFKEGWRHHAVVEVSCKHAWRRPLFKVEGEGSILLQPWNTVPVVESLNGGRIPAADDQREHLLHPCRTYKKETISCFDLAFIWASQY